MRFRKLFTPTLALALVMAIPLHAQDTTEIKRLVASQYPDIRDSIDKDKSRPAYVKRAQNRAVAKGDSILAAMRKPVTPPDTIVPPQPPAVHGIAITPNGGSIKIGGTLQLSGRPFDDAGNTVNVPVNWASSSNAIATVTASGLVTGVSAGSANITASTPSATNASRFVIVQVAANPPPVDTTTPPVTPPPTIGFDGSAELPRLQVARANPTCVTSIPVTQGMDLQQAVNMAAPGACLLLQPGSTFNPITLPNKGAGSAWITLVTQAALPATGTRMTPSTAASLRLAKILTTGYGAALTVGQGANHYRIRGVEIATGPGSQSTGVNMLIDVRNTNGTFNPTTAPSFIQFEQDYVHASSTQDIRRCFWMDAYMSSVIDSWVADCHSNNTDSQAGLHLAGARGILWENNHLEAGHEIAMFGGGGTPDSTLTPSDVTFRRNHVIRPASWKGVWQAKNIFESKHVRRLLVEGNVFENSWPDAQSGFCFVMKSENQNGDSPWTTTSDVTVRYNRITRCASGFNLAANPSSNVAIPAARFSIHDNLVDSVAKLGGDGIAIQSLGALTQEEYRANTFLNGLQGNGSNQAISFDGAPAVRAVWQGNIIGSGTYGVKGSGTSSGTPTLNQYAPGAVFTNNALVQGGACPYPPGNTCPPTAPAPSATLGVNMTLLTQLTNGVVVNDLLSLRRSVPRRNQLKYAIPAPKPNCQKPTAVCADPPMGLR